MTASIPLYAVLLTLAIAGGMYLIICWLRAIQMSTQRTTERAADLSAKVEYVSAQILKMVAAANALREAIESSEKATHFLRDTIAPAAQEIKINMASIPKLLETVARIGNAQLEILQGQRPQGRPNGPIPPRDTAAANREFEIDQMMRSEGVSRAEAELRMNPANAESVWNGNSMFEGWGR